MILLLIHVLKYAKSKNKPNLREQYYLKIYLEMMKVDVVIVKSV